jgi:hypothetical protein
LRRAIVLHPLNDAEVDALLEEVYQERARQDAQWGEQNHPDGTGTELAVERANDARDACNANARAGVLTWSDILEEEFYEALAETEPEKLRTELRQVAAVALGWMAAIDRRNR